MHGKEKPRPKALTDESQPLNPKGDFGLADIEAAQGTGHRAGSSEQAEGTDRSMSVSGARTGRNKTAQPKDSEAYKTAKRKDSEAYCG